MRRKLILTLLVIAVAFSVVAFPQVRRNRVPDSSDRNSATLTRMRKENLKNMNRERFLQVKQDSDKLLELATELNSELEDADENILSVKVVRDAENIEKLAKNIRERMSEYIGPGVE